MVKIEGYIIRIRYIGGYLIIDKFIEMNAAIEEKKIKKQNEKISVLEMLGRKIVVQIKKINKYWSF